MNAKIDGTKTDMNKNTITAACKLISRAIEVLASRYE